ncbi:hypothetical protein [Pseudomonas cerasi]|uniref:ORC-CDC6 family AAA ATPase n=1 Tax=Pseudomonas cerasi TaxID=1583341 RepID=UPI001655524A|nr:hypothetical protein [Pseudomonas cerasi]MBC8879488.1 hypothetical protein [Pseudomonas cerasi]
MNDFLSSSNDTFNARHKSALEVAKDFIPPPQFSELLGFNNCILVGPRGSGKTTLLKMLQAPALLSWYETQNTSIHQSIKFVGVFVAADVRWAKQLELVTKGISSEDQRTTIHECAFSNFVSLALIESIEKSLSLNVIRPYPDSQEIFDRTKQSELARKLSDIWQTQSTPSFSALKHALRVQQSEIPKISTFLSSTSDIESVQQNFPFVGLSWLNSLTLAIETINDHLQIENQKWALLVDELEIIPPMLLARILSPLRSTSGNLIFKYALSPTGAGSNILANHEESDPTQGNDFSTLSLWNTKKEEVRSFSSRLLVHALSSRGLIASDADISTILGISGTAEEGLTNVRESEAGRISINQRKKIFSELASKDESFNNFLVSKKIDIDELTTSDKSTNGTLVRKITPLVYLRNHVLQKWSAEKYVLRSKKSFQPYHRYPNILDLTEGNPRWILNLAENLALQANSKALNLKSQSVQTDAIASFKDRFISMLKVFPVGKNHHNSAMTPYSFLEILANHIREKIFYNEFSQDPALSFLIDKSSAEDFGEFISICIHLGALVLVDSDASKESAFIPGAAGLEGRQVRICHRLAPEFFLPLRAGRDVKMQSALGNIKLQAKTPVSPQLNVLTRTKTLDKQSQLKLF